MTADPGAYDVSLADLRTVEAERHGDAARDDTADGMVRLAAAGIDAFFGAVTPRVMPEREYLGLPPRVPPAAVEFRTEQRLRVADAVLALRAAERNGVADVYAESGSPEHREWWRMYGLVLDRADSCMGLGIGRAS